MSKKVINLPGHTSGVPIIRKKSKQEIDQEKWLKEILTREQLINEVVMPLHKTMNRLLVNVSALVTILVEKEVFTEAEFEEHLKTCGEILNDAAIRQHNIDGDTDSPHE